MKNKFICILILQCYLLTSADVWSLAIDGRETLNETTKFVSSVEIKYISTGDNKQKRLKLNNQRNDEALNLEEIIPANDLLFKITEYTSSLKELFELALKSKTIYFKYEPFFNLLKNKYKIFSYNSEPFYENYKKIFEIANINPNVLIFLKDYARKCIITSTFFYKKNQEKSIYEQYFINSYRDPSWLKQIIKIANMEGSFFLDNFLNFFNSRDKNDIENRKKDSNNLKKFLKQGLFFPQDKIKEIIQVLGYGNEKEAIDKLDNTQNFINDLKKVINNSNYKYDILNKYFNSENSVKIYPNCIFKYNGKRYTILNFIVSMYMNFDKDIQINQWIPIERNYREYLLPLIKNMLEHKYYEDIQAEPLEHSVFSDNHIKMIIDPNTTVYIMPLLYMIFHNQISEADEEKLIPIFVYLINEFCPKNKTNINNKIINIFYYFIEYVMSHNNDEVVRIFIYFLMNNIKFVDKDIDEDIDMDMDEKDINRKKTMLLESLLSRTYQIDMAVKKRIQKKKRVIIPKIFKEGNFIKKVLFNSYNLRLLLKLIDFNFNNDNKFFEKWDSEMLKIMIKKYSEENMALLLNKLLEKKCITVKEYNDFFWESFNSKAKGFDITDFLDFQKCILLSENSKHLKFEKNISSLNKFYMLNTNNAKQLYKRITELVEKEIIPEEKYSEKEYMEFFISCLIILIKKKKDKFELSVKDILDSKFKDTSLKILYENMRKKFLKKEIKNGNFIKLLIEKYSEHCLKYQGDWFKSPTKKRLTTPMYMNFFKLVDLFVNEYFEEIPNKIKEQILGNILKVWLDFDKKFNSNSFEKKKKEKLKNYNQYNNQIEEINNLFNNMLFIIWSKEKKIFDIKIFKDKKSLREMIDRENFKIYKDTVFKDLFLNNEENIKIYESEVLKNLDEKNKKLSEKKERNRINRINRKKKRKNNNILNMFFQNNNLIHTFIFKGNINIFNLENSNINNSQEVGPVFKMPVDIREFEINNEKMNSTEQDLQEEVGPVFKMPVDMRKFEINNEKMNSTEQDLQEEVDPVFKMPVDMRKFEINNDDEMNSDNKSYKKQKKEQEPEYSNEEEEEEGEYENNNFNEELDFNNLNNNEENIKGFYEMINNMIEDNQENQKIINDEIFNYLIFKIDLSYFIKELDKEIFFNCKELKKLLNGLYDFKRDGYINWIDIENLSIDNCVNNEIINREIKYFIEHFYKEYYKYYENIHNTYNIHKDIENNKDELMKNKPIIKIKAPKKKKQNIEEEDELFNDSNDIKYENTVIGKIKEQDYKELSEDMKKLLNLVKILLNQDEEDDSLIELNNNDYTIQVNEIFEYINKNNFETILTDLELIENNLDKNIFKSFKEMLMVFEKNKDKINNSSRFPHGSQYALNRVTDFEIKANFKNVIINFLEQCA